MFGFFEAFMGFLRRQIGLRDDAASATGSVHAKVKETKDYLAARPLIANGSAIKSIQRGTVAVKNGDLVTISAVVMAKSILIVTSNLDTTGQITATTTLTLDSNPLNTDGTADWQVIEFY